MKQAAPPGALRVLRRLEAPRGSDAVLAPSLHSEEGVRVFG